MANSVTISNAIVYDGTSPFLLYLRPFGLLKSFRENYLSKNTYLANPTHKTVVDLGVIVWNSAVVSRKIVLATSDIIRL